MYTLYFSPGACSLAPHVLLHEMNQEMKLVNGNIHSDKRDPEFIKLNPQGAVPVLVDDGHAIREGAAIMVYLMDKHQSPLLPRQGVERAQALQWLMFGNATLHATYSKAFMISKISGLDDAAKAACYEYIYGQINKQWAELDRELATKHYICGENITAADILFTVISRWNANLPNGEKIVIGENVARLVKEVMERPAFKAAMEHEKSPQKEAA